MIETRGGPWWFGDAPARYLPYSARSHFVVTAISGDIASRVLRLPFCACWRTHSEQRLAKGIQSPEHSVEHVCGALFSQPASPQHAAFTASEIDARSAEQPDGPSAGWTAARWWRSYRSYAGFDAVRPRVPSGLPVIKF